MPQSPLLDWAPVVLRQPALRPGPLIALFSSTRESDLSDPSGWTIQFGQLTSMPSFWSLQAYYTRYFVSNIYLSPRYLGNSPYDIALVKLSAPVTYTNHIQPICLQASTFEFQNRTDCWVTGWGNIKEDEGEAGDRQVREELSLFTCSPTQAQ